MGAVVGQKKVVGQVDLYPRAFSYGYGRKNVEKTVENVFSRISHADTESLADAIRRVGVEHGAAAKLRNAAEDPADAEGCQPVLIDFGAAREIRRQSGGRLERASRARRSPRSPKRKN